ncbi:hypothetical protein K3495_g5486 [Podosphaera aphanis]|nr:hypothetical protein K3495_g5486 [Podosphaera aphanis]
MSTDIQQTDLVRQLAANDRPTRDAALDSLRGYLAGRRALPPSELLKLWKALFYCMWMSDRPLPQQQLASALAQLVFVLPPDIALPFLRAFWQTMQREWINIDVLRMEKFLLLTRRYLGASFEFLKRHAWDASFVDPMLELLVDIPCNLSDLTVPNGMRYHVIDIYVDELERIKGLEENNVPLEKLLEPLRKLAESSPTKTVRKKAREALQDERLPGVEKPTAVVTEDEWGGFKD